MKPCFRGFFIIALVTLTLNGFSQKAVIGQERLQDEVDSVSVRDHRYDALFVSASDTDAISLMFLIAYDEVVAAQIRETTQRERTPLVVSVSTLPFNEVTFDPKKLRFEQQGRIGRVNQDWIVSLDQTKFGGIVSDDEVHQAVILLPDWVDVSKPFNIRYQNHEHVAFSGR